VQGDVIDVDPGTYVDCVSITKPQVTLRAAGPGVRITPRGGCTVIFASAAGTVIEGIEVSDFRNSSGNGYGIDSNREITLRRVYVHDGDYGVSAFGALLVIENSRFEHLGAFKGGGEVSSALQPSVQQVVIRNSSIIATQMQGDSFKSFGPEVLLECNTIAELDGLATYSVNLQRSGKGTLRYNVIEQGPAGGTNTTMISYATTSIDPTRDNQLIMEENIVINDAKSANFVVFNKGAPTVFTAKGNQFIGPGSLSTRIDLQENMRFATRQAAGLAPYPALPMHPKCPAMNTPVPAPSPSPPRDAGTTVPPTQVCP
jgi:hypothetical protein